MRVYLLKLPTLSILCHKGTSLPINFDTTVDAQSWLDNNEHPEDDFEIIEATSWEDLEDYLKHKNSGA